MVSVNGGTISLSGGAGGAASAFGNGGNGGNGGALSQSGGTFNFNSGTIATPGRNWRRCSASSAMQARIGAAGSVNVTGGVFNFTAGQITADASIIPPTPAALVKATMNLSGGRRESVQRLHQSPGYAQPHEHRRHQRQWREWSTRRFF